MLRLMYQRAPCRRQVANRILARGATTDSRFQDRLATPDGAAVAADGCRHVHGQCRSSAGSPTEMAFPTRIRPAPLLALLRIRKLSRRRPFRLSLGEANPSSLGLANPTLLVGCQGTVDGGFFRIPAMPDISCRHIRPVTSLVMTPSGAIMKLRPAASLRFQALKLLIRSTGPWHGDRWVAGLFLERVSDQLRALVVGKAGGARMSEPTHPRLSGRRVQRANRDVVCRITRGTVHGGRDNQASSLYGWIG